MPIQTLQIIGQLEPEMGTRYARLHYDHGDGFEPSILVGHSLGVRNYRYIFKVLPDRSTHTVLDPENGNAVTTWAVYLRRFHGYRMVDGAPFNALDQETGTTALVKFIDDELVYKAIGRNVYSCEIRLKQYREADD